MSFPVDAADVQGVELQAPWHLLRRGRTKVAFSLKELVGLTSEFSIRHAPNCSSQVLRTDREKFLLVYKVTCGESYSNPSGHTVRLKFDFKRMKESGSVNDLDVRVSCSCPAFLWWGQQWNISTGDALYGAPRPKLQPPTDPKRYQNIICKHLKVVADRVGPVLERMLGAHLTEQDKARDAENQKQIELVKQRTQHEVEKKVKEKEAPEEPLPISPVIPEEGEDLDAMPEDLGTLGLPKKEEPKPEAEAPREPITPKEPKPKQYLPDKVRDLLHLPKLLQPVQRPVEPEEEEPKPVPKQYLPDKVRDLLHLPKLPKEPEVGSKAKRKSPSNVRLVDEDEIGPKAKRRKLPSNIKLVDEDDETVTLPGSKAKRMMQQRQEDLGEVDYLPKKVEEAGPKAKRMITPKPRKPKLPPNMKLIDDDSDDKITKINRLKHASALILALPEGA